MTLVERTVTNVFVVLTLAANAFALWVLLSGVLAGVGARRPFVGTVEVLRAWTRPLAVAVATTSTLGSLYYSEVVGFTPCRLCWYQRAAMYPLVVILAVGLWPPARLVTRRIAVILVTVGASIAVYHWLVERVPLLADTGSCSLRVPCSVPWFTRLDFVTIAWMALSGFLAIGALLACEAAAPASGKESARLSAHPEAREGEMS